MQIQFFSFCLWHACSHSFKCLENSTKEIFVWSQTSFLGLLRSKNKRVLIAGCVEERYMQILVCEETINSLFSAVQQWGPTHVNRHFIYNSTFTDISVTQGYHCTRHANWHFSKITFNKFHLLERLNHKTKVSSNKIMYKYHCTV